MVQFAEQQSLFRVRPAPGRIVANDARHADHRPAGTPHRRNALRHLDLAGVLATQERFLMADDLPLFDPTLDFILLGALSLEEQGRDRDSDHFGGSVAQQAFCAGVPAGDYSVEIMPDDRVIG